MGRKRVARVPKSVLIKCPHCLQGMRVDVSFDKGVHSIQCKKCLAEIRAPITQCCVVCAFSDKKCPYSVMVEAKAKGLEIR